MNWASQTECAKYLGVSQGNVWDLLDGRQKSIKGWKLRTSRGRVGNPDIITIPVNLLKRNFNYANGVVDLKESCTCLFKLINKTAYTGKKALGDLTTLVSTWNPKTYEDFKKMYMDIYASDYHKSMERFIKQMRGYHISKSHYTDAFLKEFFEQGTLYSAYVGVKNQNIACQALADFLGGVEWHLASSKEDSEDIDAYVNGLAVQVKTHNSNEQYRYDANRLILYNAEKGNIKVSKTYFMNA